jgi:tRNA-dihydrouridine synthase
MNFWDKLPRPFFALAPMEDVTDVVFRRVILRAGEIMTRNGSDFLRNRPNVFFTEFTNAASFTSEKGEFSTRGRLVFTPDEQPIVAQIWGTDPENFREMSARLAEKGFAGIDINMGCPDKSVVKNGAGSALIKNPELATRLIRAAKVGADDKIPISVKTRLGFSRTEEFREWISRILCENVANLTIHLRTRREMSKVPAHFELISEILKMREEISPATKIMINGDVLNRAHGREIWEKFDRKIDGFMIGRGVFANPFCFAESAENLATRENLFELLRFHLDEFDKFRQIPTAEPPQYGLEIAKTENGEILQRKFDPLKHFFKVYVKDFAGAKELREKMFAAKNTDEIREILHEFED